MNSKASLRTSVGSVLFLVLAGHSAGAMAQSAPNQPTAPDQSATDRSLNKDQIDDIIITANKREESINKVGLTIKAIGGPQLEQQRVATLQDLAAAVPGLNFAQTENATPVYTLRGIGFYDTAIGASPAVSVYLDQAPLPLPVMTTLTLFDIERIEVLKGPQGTLFGNNSTGGAINYIAAKPTKDPRAGVSLTYSRFDTFSTDAYVSGPLSGNLLGRIAVSATSGGGWQRSISRPDDKNGAPETFAARFLLDWQPTSRLRIQTNLNGWRDRSQPAAAQFVAYFPNYPVVLPVPFVPNATDNAQLAEWSPESAPEADNRLLQATARIDYDVTSSIVLTSMTSYADYKQNMRPEGDGLVLQRNDIRDFVGSVQSFSQEIRLANNTDPTFRWTIGANFASDKSFDSLSVWYKDNTSHYTFGYSSNGSSVSQLAKTYAGFGSAEYTIGQFTLKGGARYTQADRSAVNCLFALNDNGQTINLINRDFGATVPGTCLTLGADFKSHAVHGKLNENNVSWRAGIDWKPSDTVLVYANVSKGYKAGSFGNFGGATDISYTPVKQEAVLTYEGGIKAQLFDRKLSLTGAVFYSDYTNKQIKSKLDSGPPFGYLLALVNVPKSEIKGAEFEATARPFAGLTIGAAATYLDTKIKNSIGPDGKFLLTLVNNQTNSAGNPIPYASKWTLSGNFDYTFSIGGGADAFLGGQVMYRTKTNASIGNEPIVDIPGYTTVDLQAGVNFGEGKYRVMIWGKNVFDEFYLTNRNFSFDGVSQFAGRPATYGVTLGAKF